MCYNCGSTDHFIAKCPYEIKDNKYKKDKKESKTDHTKSKKYMGEAHIGHEWDSTRERISEKDEKMTTVAIHKPSSTPRLFNNMSDDDYYSPHICLMAKGEKVNQKPNLLHLLVISLVVILVIALVMMDQVMKKLTK